MIELNEHTIDSTSTISHYQLQRLLARGGMSHIYLAHDTETQRLVAMKLVHKDAGDYCTRFQREVKATANLHHDHILPAFDYGEEDSWCYMVMPYIGGGTLKQRLEQGPLPLKEAEKLFTQLADAVQFAHEHGILHRDIKPSNILLRDGDHVYLTDFGLVRNIEEESNITATGFVIGTPEYIAPEQVEHSATPGSDVYALGIVLYEMLVGRVPFKGSSPIGTCWKHLHEQPMLPSMLNPAISARTQAVMLRALEKDPAQRYQSAHDLAVAFQDSLKPESHSLAATATLTLPVVPTGVQRSSRRASKVHPGMFILVALMLLFIVPTTLGFMLSRSYGANQYNQAPTLLGASGTFFRGQLSGKPPTHPTPSAQGTPVKTATPTNTPGNYVPVSTQQTGGANNGGSQQSGGNSGNHKHQDNKNGNGHKNDKGHKGNGNGNNNGGDNDGGDNGNNNNSVQSVVTI